MCCTLAAVKQMIALENHFSYNEILTWIQVIGFKTAAPERRSVSTQLSMKTRQISLRSTGLWPFRWSSHAKKKSFFASTIMHICGGSCQGYLFLVFALKLHRHKFPAQIVGVCTVTFPLDSPMVFLQPTLVKRSSKSPRLSLEEDP